MNIENVKSMIKKYRWTSIFTGMLVVLYFFNRDIGIDATSKALLNFKSMLSVLPPILILIGLLDAWVPKETMIKYMGESSGVKGILIALLLGSLAAGPLYAAFPIAAVLMKKNARFVYVLFFLGVWSSSKLTLLIYEFTSFGGFFTITHILSSLTLFLIGSYIIEGMIDKETLERIYASAANM